MQKATRSGSASSAQFDGRNVTRTERKCGTCDKVCKDNDKSLLCKGCDRFFHAGCQNVSDAKYEVLAADNISSTPSLLWFCNSSCNFFAAKVMGSMVEMRKELDTVKERVDKISADAGKIDLRISEIDGGLLTEEHNEAIRRVVKEEIEEGAIGQAGATSANENIEQMKDKVAGFVNESIEEIRERDYRRRNFIIHNVPMSKAVELQKRIKHDQKCFEQLCKDGLELKDAIKVVKIVRLGKKTDRKRPMKVSTTSPDEANIVFRACKNLKDKDKFKNVQIVGDRTPLEREHLRRLHEEKEKKQEVSDKMGEEVTWTVRKGKLVAEKNVDNTEELNPEEEKEEDPDEFWG